MNVSNDANNSNFNMNNLIKTKNSVKVNISTKDKNDSNGISIAKGMTVAKKGDAGYMKSMDLDEDGVITMDEFNKYCEDNSISNEEKLKLFSLMTSAKTNKTLTKDVEVEKSNDNKSEDITENADNTPVYANEGDSKYDVAMDSNSDGKVSYKEYMEYCNNKMKNEISHTENADSSTKKGLEAYNKEVHSQSEDNSFFENEI